MFDLAFDQSLTPLVALRRCWQEDHGMIDFDFNQGMKPLVAH